MASVCLIAGTRMCAACEVAPEDAAAGADATAKSTDAKPDTLPDTAAATTAGPETVAETAATDAEAAPDVDSAEGVADTEALAQPDDAADGVADAAVQPLPDTAALPDAATAADAAAEVVISPDTATVTDTSGATDTTNDTGPPPPPAIAFSGPIACPPGALPLPGVFTDVAAVAGIDLVRPTYWPTKTPYADKEVRDGGGAAVADFDGDGVPDLYFAVITGTDRLYLSGGKGPYNYTGYDIGIDKIDETSAVAADLDHDGDPDLVIGGNGLHLLRNDGPAKFTDVTDMLNWSTNDLPLMGPSLADFDGDGLLDILAVPNHFEQADAGFSWPPPLWETLLFRGTAKWQYKNVYNWLPPLKKGIAYTGSWFDYDNDGDLDFLIVNDFGTMFAPNHLVRNDGLGPGNKTVFTDVSAATTMDIATNGMGCAIGDYDRDGDLDVFVTGFQGENMLLANSEGGKSFWEVTDKAACGDAGPAYVSWGASFFDADADGWLDLYVANGQLLGAFKDGPFGNGGSGPNKFENPKLQSDRFWHNAGDGTFTDFGATAKLGSKLPNRSIVWADLDGDGFLELIVGGTQGAPLVYRNGCDNRPWLEVKLHGTASNRDGIGARVTVEMGSVKLIREIEAGSTGLWGSNQPIAHFGLGAGNNTIDKLTVRWPNNKVQVFSMIAARQIVTITEGP